ncbi:MAG: glycosyltransferase family 4 protein [bacterium]|nr:glycosyltransferase family 4 protein [bacterium]
MKKVLFVITKSNWGGAQRYVCDLAASLPKGEYDIAVALGGTGALAVKLKEAGVRVVGIPHLERDINFIKELLSTLYLWKIFLNEKPDVIHLNSSKIGGLGALVAYILRPWDNWDRKGTSRAVWKPKVIFTVHGWAFNERRNFIYQGIIYFLQWLTAFLSDNIIILSRHDYRQAVEMPLIDNEKFVLLPLGIKMPEFLSQKAAREFFQPKDNQPMAGKIGRKTKIIIGTIAEFTKNKGLEYLVESSEKMKKNENAKLNFQTVIIGGGEHFEKIKKDIADKKLENEIILTGFIMDAAKYLKAFDIFILPSLKEGLPYVVLEAMNAGLPIVASSVGGLTDLIENEKNGILIPPKNSAEIAEALGELIHHPAKRKKYGEHSLELATQKFSFEKMLSGTIDIYNKA